MHTHHARLLILAATTTLLLTGCGLQSNQHAETHGVASSQVGPRSATSKARAATLDDHLEQFGKAYYYLTYRMEDLCNLLRQMNPESIQNHTFRLEIERAHEDLVKEIERFEKRTDFENLEEVIIKHLKPQLDHFREEFIGSGDTEARLEELYVLCKDVSRIRQEIHRLMIG